MSAAPPVPLPSSSSSITSSASSGAVSALAGTNKIRIRPGLFKVSSQGSSSNLKTKSTKQRLEDEALGLTHDIGGADETDEPLGFPSTASSTAAGFAMVPDQSVYSTEEDYPPPTKSSGPPVYKHKNVDGIATAPPPPGMPAEGEVFCTCRQVSFGEMIGCDNPKCRLEW